MCIVCKESFTSQRGLSMHLLKAPYCVEMLHSFQNQSKYTCQASLIIQSSYDSTNNQQNQSLENMEDINIKKRKKEIEKNNNCIFKRNQMNEESSLSNICDNNITEYQSSLLPNNVFHEVKLLKLLNDLGTPLYAYKHIMDWAKEAYISNFNFETKHTNYHQIIKYLETKLQLGICRPLTILVQLYGDKMEIDVVVFDIPKMLMSLFNDNELNKYENLVVNSVDQFSKYIPADGRIGEVNSGKWYNVAYTNCIKDPTNEFLCPLILANDKTTLSEIGNLHVDAIFMTTSVFNVHVSALIYIIISHLLTSLFLLKDKK